MKVFLVLWVCMQSATLPLDKTCFQTVNQKIYYDTVQECKKDFDELSAKIMFNNPGLYLTMFCTTKKIEII